VSNFSIHFLNLSGKTTEKLKNRSKAWRIVIIWYHTADEDLLQLKLFEIDWQTMSMVTNLDLTEKDVRYFYNQRLLGKNMTPQEYAIP